ncbi:MAG: R3H domain-containing nucleic acid-binding protein [Bdellovibrionota bacterium]
MISDDPGIKELEEKLKDHTLDRFISAKGKVVNLDYFFYSCMEQMATQKAHIGDAYAGKFPPLIKYAESKLVASGGEASDDACLSTLGIEKPGDLPAFLPKLFAWYKEEYPELSLQQPLDYATAAELVPAFALLLIDLEELVLQVTNEAKMPGRGKSDASAALWSVIDRLLSDLAPTYADYFIKFLDWKYTESSLEELDLKSIPPVGRFSKMLLKGRVGGRGKPSRDSGRSGSGKTRTQKEHSSTSKGRHGGKDRRPPRTKNGKPNRVRRDRELEKIVLKEADEAISKMKADGGLRELLLKPQNSFLRRLQHQRVVDAGYVSMSCGEGDERAVKIYREV